MISLIDWNIGIKKIVSPPAFYLHRSEMVDDEKNRLISMIHGRASVCTCRIFAIDKFYRQFYAIY